MATQTLEFTTGSNSERVYSLDALRGIMMMLGIVIHASVTYGTIDHGTMWILKDQKSTSLLFDIIPGLIHAFRMPVFMVAAGYFGALLFYKKGSQVMIRNRVNRILFPLLVGVQTIIPLAAFSFVYSKAALNGASDALHQAVLVITTGAFLPYKTGHLWFLYYLFIFSLLTWMIAKTLNKETPIIKMLNDLYCKIIGNFWLRLIFTSTLTFGCLHWMGSFFLLTNNRFSINPSVFAAYFLFYGLGWMLFRTNSLRKLSDYALVQLVIATMLFVFILLFHWPVNEGTLTIKQIISSLSTSLFVFGFIALFIKHFNSPSPRIKYLMEASYWVYIIHLPISVFIPGLIGEFAWPAVVKFSIAFSTTTLISFVSYHYLVRNTFIGMFLNGKVHSIKTDVNPQKNLAFK